MYALLRSQLRLPISKLDHWDKLVISQIRGCSTYKVTLVISIAVIIAEDFQRVVFVDVFRMLLDELLDTVPERGNSFDILVKRDNETIFFLVVAHELEWIIVNITEKFNTWLNSPVPFVIHHQGLSEEEARFESAHMSIADGITVDDLPLCHIFSNLSCLVLVDPRRK